MTDQQRQDIETRAATIVRGLIDPTDDVLDNSGGAAALAPQVERLHRKYLRLAQSKRTAARPRPPDA